jgi:uncharacterized OB-fold protein
MTAPAELDFASMITETAVSAPYWAALRAGRLDFQRCGSCGNAWLPPREECPRCLEAEWDWETASGRGRVISWVVYHHPPNEMWAGRVPYNVAIVELDEGPRLITNLLEGGRQILIEAPVELEVQEEGGLAMARFRLA